MTDGEKLEIMRTLDRALSLYTLAHSLIKEANKQFEEVGIEICHNPLENAVTGKPYIHVYEGIEKLAEAADVQMQHDEGRLSFWVRNTEIFELKGGQK